MAKTKINRPRLRRDQSQHFKQNFFNFLERRSFNLEKNSQQGQQYFNDFLARYKCCHGTKKDMVRWFKKHYIT